MLHLIQLFQQNLGMPDELEQDPRAGNAAIWGSRANGCFCVSRGPIDTRYEVALLPAPKSSLKFQKLELTEAELNQWFEENVGIIRQVLQGL